MGTGKLYAQPIIEIGSKFVVTLDILCSPKMKAISSVGFWLLVLYWVYMDVAVGLLA